MRNKNYIFNDILYGKTEKSIYDRTDNRFKLIRILNNHFTWSAHRIGYVYTVCQQIESKFGREFR